MNAATVLDIARGELGTMETPAGSNCTRYGAWYGLDGQPWCMMFVQWCFHKAGGGLLLRTASCGAMLQAAKEAGQWVTEDYQPGDVLLYDFNGDGRAEHCGIVAEVGADGITAIEGNTGYGNEANGGMVMERVRRPKTILGAFRPRFTGGEAAMTQGEFNQLAEQWLKERSSDKASEWSREARNWAEGIGIIKGDGKGWQALLTVERLVTILHRLVGRWWII